MKFFQFFLLFICAFTKVEAQINLVLNPCFEQFSTCPNQLDEAKYCTYWMSLDSAWSPPDWAHDPPGVPDFCNTCAADFDVSVPSNSRFYHYPHSGNGMVQMQDFIDRPDTFNLDRDYLQGHLTQTLLAGHIYNVFLYESRTGKYFCN